jgi:cephalosporin hydroxylase
VEGQKVNLEAKFEQTWRQLKRLHTLPIDLARVDLLRQATSSTLLSIPQLTDLIADLGLNDEAIVEFPPALAPYCGQGLRIWQYPIQFAPYLIDLSQLQIHSYLEVGVRHGGSFVATVEYLQRFHPIQRAIAIDIIPCPALTAYHPLQPTAEFMQMNSLSAEFAQMIARQDPIDLVFIDSFQDEQQYTQEFQAIKAKARYIAFHDICNSDHPGVQRFWQNLKASGEYDCREYIEQYPDIPVSYMGIGLAVQKENAHG